MNPFWSQRACDEAMLKAMRPSTLPQNQGGDAQVAVQASPPREITGAELVKGVVEENARLWHYINQMQKAKDRDYQSMQASLVGAAMSGPDAAGPGAWWAEAAGGGWPQWAWPGAQSSSALPAWGGDGPTSSPGLGIGSTAKKAVLDLLGGVRGWPPQAAGDDPHGAGDQGQPDVQAFGSARAHHPGHQQGQGSGVPHGAGSGGNGAGGAGPNGNGAGGAGPGGNGAGGGASGGYDGGPGGNGAGGFPGGMGGGPPGYPRVVIFLEEVRVVPVEGFLIIPEVAVSRVVVLLVVGLEVHLAVPQMVMEEGFLAVFMEEAVNFLDG